MLKEARQKGSPWHQGEVALQRSVGLGERMDVIGRKVVRSFLTDQHQSFYPLLPFIVLGTVDERGNAWATMRAGYPGFMRAKDPQKLEVRLPRVPEDPADEGMDDGDAIGMLGIQFETRRRNRLNGTVRRENDSSFSVSVAQSFGNCPQYIHVRDFEFVRDPSLAPTRRPVRLDHLDQRAHEMIANADMFFVATYVDPDDGERQVDVSHRGGVAGFVCVQDGMLTIPDYPGNHFFNTLGNIRANPKAGLVFVDFATGDMLQMTGGAEVILDSPELSNFDSAERLWRFISREIVYRPEGMPLHWTVHR